MEDDLCKNEEVCRYLYDCSVHERESERVDAKSEKSES